MALRFLYKKPGVRIKMKSFRRDSWYTIDKEDKTCSCKAFQYSQDKSCKHLQAIGIWPTRTFYPKTHPTFSQALSGLVKALRVRRLEDAVYWMVYMDGMKGFEQKDKATNRMRVARRLLIGSAEDGHSVAVMERCVKNYPEISKLGKDLVFLVAEAVRICKVPNWWHPDSNGPDYIYQGLLGFRAIKTWKERTPEELTKSLYKAVEEQDKPTAIGAVLAFMGAKLGSTRQAEVVREGAINCKNDLAVRLCDVHLSAKSALNGDNNFLSQAAWIMAGGSTPVADVQPSVIAGECYQLIIDAQEKWKNPQPIPKWCCDGQHSAGDDVRFMGEWQHMNAVCEAYKHYQTLDLTDKEWLPQFMSYDGLQVEVL